MKVLRGVGIAALGLFALNNLLRGGVHVFSADGGAATAAGLDLSASGGVIISLFAAIGVMQMAVGGFELFVLTLRRDLLAIALGLQATISVGSVLVLQLWKPLPTPGAMTAISLALAGLAVVGWGAALASRRSLRLGERA